MVGDATWVVAVVVAAVGAEGVAGRDGVRDRSAGLGGRRSLGRVVRFSGDGGQSGVDERDASFSSPSLMVVVVVKSAGFVEDDDPITTVSSASGT